jgi:hypothetical protein
MPVRVAMLLAVLMRAVMRMVVTVLMGGVVRV